jgi:fructose-specific phosphotransferase system IIC component
MSNDFINNLGLIISSIVSKKLQLSHLETGILSSIFSMIFVNAFNYQYNLNLHLYLLWYILPIIPILAIYYSDTLMYYYYKGNDIIFTPKC